MTTAILMGAAGRRISCAQIMTSEAHNGKSGPFVGPAPPPNARESGVDRQLAGFYRERYLLAKADWQSKRNCRPAAMRIRPG